MGKEKEKLYYNYITKEFILFQMKHIKVIENFEDGQAKHQIELVDEMPEGIINPIIELVNEQVSNKFYRDFFEQNGRDFDPIKDQEVYAARFAQCTTY